MNATQHAYETIRGRLASTAWEPGQKLPTLTELAAQSDVSLSTIWRVVGRLKKESLVHGRRGGALVAGPAGVAMKNDSISKGPAWRRLKDRMGQEILIGTSLESEIPPISKMAKRYSVAIDTCKKALNELVREGLLKREGRRFQKAYGRLKHYRSGIILVASGDSEHGISITEPRIEHAVESFERECFRLDFQSRCEGYNIQDPSAFIRMNARLMEIEPVLGYIISMWNPGTALGWNRWLDLVQSLLNRGKPVVALDQDGALVFPPALLAHPQFRVLRIAGLRAGEMVGRVLLRQGHRRVAFLMPYGGTPWAQNRFAGVSQCYRQYGGAEATVELHTSDESVETDDLILAILGLDEKEVRSVYGGRASSNDLRDLVKRLKTETWLRLKEKIPQDLATRSASLFAKFLAGFTGEDYDPWVYDRLLDTMIHVSSNVARDRYVAIFLSAVLQKSMATAWVCAEDIIALNAVKFLRGRGTRVPEDISVRGFENYRESHEQQLSTLDFNMTGMVQQALLMILDPKNLKGRPVITEVDGYVVERRTTRR